MEIVYNTLSAVESRLQEVIIYKTIIQYILELHYAISQ